MARMKLPALLIVLLCALAGCSAFFEFNAFTGLEQIPAPKLSDYTGLDGLAQLSADLSSPAVVAALAADPSTTKAIGDYLLTYISGSVNSPAEQQAVILYCDLYLKTTAGEEFVNNIVTTVVGGVSPTSTIQDLLNSIIPPEARTDPAVFSAMVNALLLANTQYLALGTGLQDLNTNGQIDPGESVPPGTNMGDVAQKAAVAFTMDIVFQQIDAALTGAAQPHAPGDVINQMYLLSTDPASAHASVQSLNPDPFNPANTGYGSLKKLFDCAGIPIPA